MSSEWVKILVSATVGMFTGLIADPIRGLIQSRIDIPKIENAILWDLSELSQSAVRVHDGELPAWKLWLSAELPSFDHYCPLFPLMDVRLARIWAYFRVGGHSPAITGRISLVPTEIAVPLLSRR